MPSEQLLSGTEWATVVRRELGEAQDFSIEHVDAGPLSDKINGFMGDHILIVVTVSLTSKDDPSKSQEQKLKFFLKKVPRKYEFQTEYVTSSFVFDKETNMYTNIIQYFKQVLSDVREDFLASPDNDIIPTVDKEVQWSSKCLLTGEEVIVLEDLAEKGFHISNLGLLMDVNHCVVVLRGLAALHASSIIVEERKRRKLGDHYTLLDDYSTTLKENFIINEGESKVKLWYKASVDALDSLVPHLTKYGPHSKHHQEVKRKFRSTCEKIINLVKPSKKYRNVLCHGDLWSNNMMFCYDEDQKTPLEVRFVDFQMVRYAPPATDVFMFLQTNTDRAFREAHLEALLRKYHDFLCIELRRYGMDVSQLLPWGVFRESCTYLRQAGWVMAALYHHFILLPEDIMSEGIGGPDGYDAFVCGTREKEVHKAFFEDKKYRDRLESDIEEIIENMILLPS